MVVVAISGAKRGVWTTVIGSVATGSSDGA
jgi:hypothetical protein